VQVGRAEAAGEDRDQPPRLAAEEWSTACATAAGDAPSGSDGGKVFNRAHLDDGAVVEAGQPWAIFAASPRWRRSR